MALDEDKFRHGGYPAGSTIEPDSTEECADLKTYLDPLLAALLFVPLLPLMLGAMLLVKLTSPGPVFYSQVRLGYRGRRYRIYKIRTMQHDCERHTGPRWSTPGDPRITRVGRFLRITHLDELPQLWNVLRGDMSLVGPRPERPEIAASIELALPQFRERTDIRPGVTGLAQIQLPPDTDLDSVRRKLTCDLYYLRSRNLWLDLRIMLGTIPGALGIPYRVTSRLLAIPSLEWIEEIEAAPEPRRAAAAEPEFPALCLPQSQSQLA